MNYKLNIAFLYELMAWMGLGDANWDDGIMIPYLTLDVNDEISFKKYVAANIKPKLKQLTEASVKAIEESLAGCLLLPPEKIGFNSLVSSSLPPFEVPSDCRKLFVWIAEECFPAGSVHTFLDKDNVEVYLDSNEVNRLTKYK
jgi:hypothetical protein